MCKALEDWEFNVLGIYNYNRDGHLRPYFDFIRENLTLPGDICEAGVFNGKSLLATALMLKELGSPKRVVGYDTWSGFPPIVRPEDGEAGWRALLESGRISDDHYVKVEKLRRHRSLQLKVEKPTVLELSTSLDFSGASLDNLKEKINYLGLNNIDLIKGRFADTMRSSLEGQSGIYMAALIDADLYESYKVALPFVWSRLVSSGFIYLDEYYSLKFPGARIACDDFLANINRDATMYPELIGHFERWFIVK